MQADSLPAEPPGKPKNPGVDSLSLLQRIFLSQESNRGLMHGRLILYQLSYWGSPRVFIIFVTMLLLLYFFFYFFDLEACGISAPQPDFKPIAPSKEGEVLTIGLPGKSLPCTFKPWSLSTSSLMVFFILAVLSTASNQGCPPQMATSLISLVSVFNLCYGAENTQVWIICLPLLCSILFLSREENAFGLKKNAS